MSGFRDDRDAVEPAVGVILMVAIVVILSFGIWALWSNYANDNIQRNPMLSARADDADAPLTAATDDELATVTSRQGSECIPGDQLRFRLLSGGNEVPIVWTAPDEWCAGGVITLVEDGADAGPGDYDVQIIYTVRETLLLTLDVTIA